MSTANEPASTVEPMQVPELDAPRIIFSVTNKKKPTAEFAYIYMTDNRQSAEQWGHLEISIQNPDSSPIVITDVSRLEIHVPGDLLSMQDLRLIQLEAPSETIWTLDVKANNVLLLQLKQGRTISIFNGSSATVLLLGALAPIGKAMDRSLTFVWYEFQGINNYSRGFRVVREFIPNQNRDLRIKCSWSSRDEYRNASDNVYVTPSTVRPGFPGIENRLILTLEKTELAELKATTDAEFVVSFTTEQFGDPISALCTNEQLKLAICKCMEPPDKAWVPTQDDHGKLIRWVLKPPVGTILDTKGVSFEFTGIVTRMPMAPASRVLIHWRGFEGYNPGSAVLTVSKNEAYPYVLALKASLNGEKLAPGQMVDFKAPVELEWDLFAADGCTISTLPGTFGWKGTAIVSPEKQDSEFELVPRITLDAHVKKGEGKSAVVVVRDPEIVSFGATEAGLLYSNVDMTWECKSGDCFLSGPGLQRVQVERSGTRTVSSDKPPFLLECIGFKTVTRQLYVQIPTANCSIEVEWLPDVRKGRWKWKTSYATKCEVMAESGGTVAVISTDLSGSVDLNSESYAFLIVAAYGNGMAATIGMVFPGDKVLPEIHFQELKLPSGPNHQATWEFLHGRTTEIECTNVGKDILWKSDAASGHKEYEFGYSWRSYFMGIEFGGPDSRSAIALGVAPNGPLTDSKDLTNLADSLQAIAHYHSSTDAQNASGPRMAELFQKLLGG
ncbi:MAG: hypothetical protein ABR976_10030 [Terracidiphilus sp.]